MAEKYKNYNDFSNRKPFNGIPLREDEVLAPLVIDDDFRDYLKTLELIWDNAETWHFPRCSEGVPVCFFPVKKDEFEQSMSLFNDQVSRYLKRFQKTDEDETLSLDAFLDAMDDDDGDGFDPTGTTEHEDNFMLELAFNLLVEDLNKQDPNYGRVITMLRNGCKKGAIIKEVNPEAGKSQGYEYIKKVQVIAKTIWDEKYR
jgi:hypothetical protein